MLVLASLLDALIGLPGFVLLVLLVLVAFRALTVVDAHAKYVVTDDDGIVVEVLEPGVHVRSPLTRGNTIVDVRTRTFESTFEDVGTSDEDLADLDVELSFHVTDARAAVEDTEDYPLPPWAEMTDHELAILEALEVTLLDHARRLPYDDIADAPEEFAADCEADLAPALAAFGVELEALDLAAVSRAADRDANEDAGSRDGAESGDAS